MSKRNDESLGDGPATLPPALRGIPHLDQYCGVWAIHEQWAKQLQSTLSHDSILAHVMETRSAGKPRPQDRTYELTADGVAVLSIVGPMTKYGSFFFEFPGTLAMRQSLRAAVRDEAVRAVLIQIDSPGGNAAGVHDLADEVAATNAVKPTFVAIEDMGASAAYYVASQAERVIVNPSALVGSIGVYTVVDDFSMMFAQKGIKTHVIRSGDRKGAGVQGAPITADDLADIQRIVDSLHELFVASVARGRGMDREAVNAVADGRIFIGSEAVSLGLADEVGTMETALDRLVAAIPRTRGGIGPKTAALLEVPTMDPTTTPAAGAAPVTAPQKPAPATVAELVATFPKATPAFRESCLLRGYSLAEAQTAWMRELESRCDALQASATATAQAAGAVPVPAPEPAKRPGLPALGGSAPAESESGPIIEWHRRLAEMTKKGLPRDAAVRKLVREDPALYDAYTTAYNEQHAAARKPGKRGLVSIE